MQLLYIDLYYIYKKFVPDILLYHWEPVGGPSFRLTLAYCRDAHWHSSTRYMLPVDFSSVAVFMVEVESVGMRLQY